MSLMPFFTADDCRQLKVDSDQVGEFLYLANYLDNKVDDFEKKERLK